MSKIVIALCGLENSQKYVYANRIHAYMLNNYVNQPNGIKSQVGEDGRLRVLTEFTNENGTRDTSMEVLNVFRRDYEYQDWASQILWPYIKIINFTDPVLNIMETMFGFKFKVGRKKSPVQWKSIGRLLGSPEVVKLKAAGKYDKRISLNEMEKLLAYNIFPLFRKRCLIDFWTTRFEETNTKIVVVTDAFKLDELNKLQYEKAIMIHCPGTQEDISTDYFAGKDELSSFEHYDYVTNDETNIVDLLKERIQF